MRASIGSGLLSNRKIWWGCPILVAFCATGWDLSRSFCDDVEVNVPTLSLQRAQGQGWGNLSSE
jgi:hypothetical protein